MYNNEEILYPIFLKCCSLTKDIYWITIFTELSKGITPYGTYINKNYLYCNYKGKEFSYKINETFNDTHKLFNDLINLFKSKLGLFSITDRTKEQEDFIKYYENNDKNKKNINNILIEKFIIKMKNKYMLTDKQTKRIYNVLICMINIKIINSNNIILDDNNNIKEIKGIVFSNKKISINIDTNINYKEIQSSKKNIYMYNNWDKYVKDIYKLNQSLA